jgi:hypothetical protein
MSSLWPKSGHPEITGVQVHAELQLSDAGLRFRFEKRIGFTGRI